MDELLHRLRVRPAELNKLRKKGVKVIGSTGSYIPDELIYAASAVPQHLCRGGEPEPVEATLPYIPRFMSPFARAQFGYYVTGTDPSYRAVDMLVAQCTDCHAARLADLFEFFTEMPVVKIGVPNDWDKPLTAKYYLEKLYMLKGKLEKFTGREITDEKLRESLRSHNKMRSLLKDISLLRSDPAPPLSGCDFIRLSHYSFYCDINNIINRLELFYEELKRKKHCYPSDLPRILLAGHAVAVGDYTVPRLIEKCGAVVVIEMLDEGMRHYWWNVKTEGDLMKNIAYRYFQGRVPSSVQVPSWAKRFGFLTRLIENFDVNGVVWYQLKYDEVYAMESHFVGEKLKKMRVPMLKLESNYDVFATTASIMTRIESFVESLRVAK